MKRILLSFFIAAVAVPAMAETAVDLAVIGRIDANPYFYFDGSKPEYYSGHSSLYTNLECTFGDHVALKWTGNWLATAGEKIPFAMSGKLYENIWSTNFNFTNMLYLDFYAGNWTFRFGKDFVALGGYEYEDNDWDCTFETESIFWNCYSCCQWGGSVIWMTPSEKSSFMLQALSASSLYWEKWRPWHNGYGTYLFRYSGEYGIVETNNSYGWMQTAGGPSQQVAGIEMINLGLLFNIGRNISLSLEWMNRRDTAVKLTKAADFFTQSSKSRLFFSWAICDKVDLRIDGGYEHIGIPAEFRGWLYNRGYIAEAVPTDYFFGGGTVSYYPLKDSRDLRIHFVVTGSSLIGKGISTTLGITWNHVFKLVKK